MKSTKHILICGDVGAGKSTLIRRLVAQSSRPICGFVTKREPADESGESPTYIHPANTSERFLTPLNLIGSCNKGRCSFCHPKVFDTYGAELLAAKPDSIILMDELGFMENDAMIFRDAVIKALDGDIPVIAAVKSTQTPFLDELRGHENAQVCYITHKNRDATFEKLLPIVYAIWE